MNLGRSRWLALCALGLLGCSPTAQLQTRFVVPGVSVIDQSRLHVTGSKSCPPAAVAAPRAAATPGDIFHLETQPESGAVVVTAAFRGQHCTARLTAWYDADGSGTVNPGDLVGSTRAEEIRDRGLLSGNLTVGPSVTLRRK